MLQYKLWCKYWISAMWPPPPNNPDRVMSRGLRTTGLDSMSTTPTRWYSVATYISTFRLKRNFLVTCQKLPTTVPVTQTSIRWTHKQQIQARPMEPGSWSAHSVFPSVCGEVTHHCCRGQDVRHTLVYNRTKIWSRACYTHTFSSFPQSTPSPLSYSHCQGQSQDLVGPTPLTPRQFWEPAFLPSPASRSNNL